MTDFRADVSVIMPVKDDTLRALRAIAAVRSEICEAEVVVVDNDPTNPAVELAEAADRYVLTGGTVGAARTAGLREASRPIILFLDADQQVLPGRLRDALGLLGPADAVVLAERSANAGFRARLLDAERRLTERAGFGIPRLFYRAALEDISDDPDLSTMVFGEDSHLASGVDSVGLASAPVLLHEDPASLLTLLRKYVAYGRRAARQSPGSGVRRRRYPSDAGLIPAVADLPWLAPIGVLKVGKAVAYSYGRLAERLAG